jgi:hypothetical protein
MKRLVLELLISIVIANEISKDVFSKLCNLLDGCGMSSIKDYIIKNGIDLGDKYCFCKDPIDELKDFYAQAFNEDYKREG